MLLYIIMSDPVVYNGNTPSLSLPVIYDNSVDTSSMQNVILIDSNVTDFQQYINANTFAIIYDNTSTREQLLDVLTRKFQNISRIAVVSHYNDQPYFLNNESLFLGTNTQFIVDLIKQFHVSNMDFLACNTLQNQDWNNLYALLLSETGVKVGASNDNTGNIKYGGDWILESTLEDIQTVYFNNQIQNYTSLLADMFHTYVEPVTLINYRYTLDVSNNATIIRSGYLYTGDITIPSKVDGIYNVIGISALAFFNRTQITKIIVPNSVRTIGDSAFEVCTGLTNIKISNDVIGWTLSSRIINIRIKT